MDIAVIPTLREGLRMRLGGVGGRWERRWKKEEGKLLWQSKINE